MVWKPPGWFFLRFECLSSFDLLFVYLFQSLKLLLVGELGQ